VRALSFSQPWLWAVLFAAKRVENRSWPPPIDAIGTRIALHAAKSWDPDGTPFIRRELVNQPEILAGMPNARRNYPAGALVGTAVIDRVVTEPRRLPTEQQGWFFGPYGWILNDVRILRAPLCCNGALGLWRLSVDQEREVAEMGGS
jgi:hypothetical protein